MLKGEVKRVKAASSIIGDFITRSSFISFFDILFWQSSLFNGESKVKEGEFLEVEGCKGGNNILVVVVGILGVFWFDFEFNWEDSVVSSWSFDDWNEFKRREDDEARD